ncbi:MAG: GerW family sporulation protein [Oscillospiraceae bacterium]|nr:GerW family sporulation protein [Oscillospiraceae bacterium]
MAEHPIQGMMDTSMEKIRQMLDVNTIMGDPIITPDGTTVIPVTKVSFGFGSGGSDISAKNPKDLFGGGAGAGVTMQPVAFLVISGSDVKLLQLSSDDNAVASLVNAAPGLIDKLKETFSKSETDKTKE